MDARRMDAVVVGEQNSHGSAYFGAYALASSLIMRA
jgi:hypothetical protein